ncbi:MAG: 7-carboxy-7-deazaguanine synthase [Dehalococcoidaceae bacterium]|nr:7-carboxy-7-deazaguanine synthase [Dehalococcoidaceae bacterium]
MEIKVNEIYKSVQGESTYSGLPCTFIRLTFCNLRCSYCDTEYAFYEGTDMRIPEIIKKVNNLKCNLVEVTGGEPLVQDGCIDLLKALISNGNKILIETGGALSIEKIPKEVVIILDIKCPSSNMSDKNLWSNIDLIKPSDEIKFVIGDKKDYNWSKKIIKKYNLTDKCTILFSPVYNKIEPKTMVEWIMKDNLNVRFQTQLHKSIWNHNTKGV